jgi:signal transduction histidine kinase
MGTGLGLTNARKVIELHEGKVDISSAISRGTTITISLAYDQEVQEEPVLREAKQEVP